MKKLACVFAMAHNEKPFLKLWLDYYSQSFDPEDIYIFDHCSDEPLYINTIGNFYRPEDDSNYWLQDTETVMPCQVKRLTQTNNDSAEMFYNIGWMQAFLRSMMCDLLTRYEYVVITDPDELIFVNIHKYKNLKDYIKILMKKGIKNSRAVGYELVHQSIEPDINWNLKVFGEQRNYWMRFGMWDKTLISSEMLKWAPGFHFVYDDYTMPDEDLILCHMQRIDYKHRIKKHKENFINNYNHTSINNFYSKNYRSVETREKDIHLREINGDLPIIGDIMKIPDEYIRWLVI